MVPNEVETWGMGPGKKSPTKHYNLSNIYVAFQETVRFLMMMGEISVFFTFTTSQIF